MMHRHESAVRRQFSVNVFFLDGDPSGMKRVEASNGIGTCLVFPRVLFKEARKQKEANSVGVYILFGDGEKSSFPQIYIGEGDPVLPRLESHSREKDFWTHAIVFTRKDQRLNKAHVQYLESQLYTIAQSMKRCELVNLNGPQLPSLSEPETADVENVLEELLLCLSTLGYRFLEGATSIPSDEADSVEQSPSFGAAKSVTTKMRSSFVVEESLYLKGRGAEATGSDTPAGFVVQKGAKAAKDEVPSCSEYLHSMRAALIERGVFRDVGDTYEVTQDYTFTSPSAAADALLGRSANGRVEWKSKDGRTLKSIQDSAAQG